MSNNTWLSDHIWTKELSNYGKAISYTFRQQKLYRLRHLDNGELMAKVGFVPISFDAYVDLHMKSNPKDMTRAEVESALRSALTAHNNGARCDCGNPIWVIGSAFTGDACFTCITGEAYPDGDYEIDEAI